MTSKWTSEEDVSRDIQELSVLGVNGYFDKEILSNADEIRTRLHITRRSRFDEGENLKEILNDENRTCENVVFCKPVRGRPLKNLPRVNKPGGESSFLENQMETCATIRRELGFDFSNGIIENKLRQVNKHKGNKKPKRDTFMMPNIRFISSDSKSSSSTASNSSSNSPTFFSQQSLFSNKELTEDQCQFVSHTGIECSNILSNNEKSLPPPPPLFEIITKNKSKENVSQKQENNSSTSGSQISHSNNNIMQSETKTNCNIRTGIELNITKEQSRRKSVNLLCEKNFPPL